MKKLLVLLVFCSGYFFGQNNFDNAWFMYFGNQQIDTKWNWWTEAQFRNHDALAKPQQIILRTGIGYNLSPDNDNLLLGYGYIANFAEDLDGKTFQSSKEHRIYQQYIRKNKWGNTVAQHRFRLEERFPDNDFQLRGRYLLGLNIPLSRKMMQPEALYLSFYNEIFVVPEDLVADRNRVYGAIGFVLNKNIRFELGYMNQSVFKKNEKVFSNSNNQGQMQLGIYSTINFNKKIK